MKLQTGDESEPGGAAEALPAEPHRGRSSLAWSSGPDGDTAALMALKAAGPTCPNVPG